MRAELDLVAIAARTGRPSPWRLRDYFEQVAGAQALGAMLAQVPCPDTLRRRPCSDLEDILRCGLSSGAFRVPDVDASVTFAFDVLRAIGGDRRFPTPDAREGCSAGAARASASALEDHVGLLLKAWGDVGAWRSW